MAIQYTDKSIKYNNVTSPGNVLSYTIGRKGADYSASIVNTLSENHYLVNAIDIDWNNVSLTEGVTINTTADLLNIVSTLLGFVDIIMSVEPKVAYVYIGSLNNIKSQLLDYEGEDSEEEPIHHLKAEIDGKNETSSLVQTYMKNIAKRVKYNKETVPFSTVENPDLLRNYFKDEQLCYIGPAEFIQKPNGSNYTCLQNKGGNNLGLFCLKKHILNESSFGHVEQNHNEDQCFYVNGVKYIVAVTKSPSIAGQYKIIEWVE